jgi:hypothetical protein
MRVSNRPRRFVALCVVAGALVAGGARQASAGCNLIPGTTKTFNSALGAPRRARRSSCACGRATRGRLVWA